MLSKVNHVSSPDKLSCSQELFTNSCGRWNTEVKNTAVWIAEAKCVPKFPQPCFLFQPT